MVAAPRVSILMPTHSRVDVIGLAVESVLAQTYGDFELLVVGDGCPAETADVLAGFKDQRIRFFDLPKAPYYGYANRNIALRQSRGELIGFAADDDLLFPDHLEVLIAGIERGAAIAYSQALWISTDGIAAPFLTNLEMADELAQFRRGNTIPASCFLYRTDSLPRRDAWPEDIPSAADWRLWHSIIDNNPDRPIAHCSTPTVLHFCALWKNSRNSGMREFATMLDIADKADWWPSALRVDVAGKTEQHAYSALMSRDPASWSASMRSATSELVAKIAWHDIRTLRPELAKAKAALQQATLARQAPVEAAVPRPALPQRIIRELKRPFRKRRPQS